MSNVIKFHSTSARAVVVGHSRRLMPEAVVQDPAVVEDDEDCLNLAQQTAQAIVERAQVDAAAIRASAEQQVDDIRQEAWHEGHEEGLNFARQEMLDQVNRLHSLADQEVADNREFLKGAEQQILELALAVARKVIKHEISLDPSVVVAPIREVVENVTASAIVKVRVSPDDIELLTPLWNDSAVLEKRIELVADGHLQAGDCIVETKTGVIDAKVETKLAEIEKSFFSAAGIRYR